MNRAQIRRDIEQPRTFGHLQLPVRPGAGRCHCRYPETPGRLYADAWIHTALFQLPFGSEANAAHNISRLYVRHSHKKPNNAVSGRWPDLSQSADASA
jgi:hypothetical protein